MIVPRASSMNRPSHMVKELCWYRRGLRRSVMTPYRDIEENV